MASGIFFFFLSYFRHLDGYTLGYLYDDLI